MQILERHGKPIENEARVKEYIRQIAEFLTTDSVEFGLILSGDFGNGKTTMIRAVRKAFQLLAARGAIPPEYRFEEANTSNLLKVYEDEYWLFEMVRDCNCLCLDDLGNEATEIRDFGNIREPVIELLSHRYNMHLLTLITTNLDMNGIADKYDARIADRFSEMMKWITVKENSYR